MNYTRKLQVREIDQNWSRGIIWLSKSKPKVLSCITLITVIVEQYPQNNRVASESLIETLLYHTRKQNHHHSPATWLSNIWCSFDWYYLGNSVTLASTILEMMLFWLALFDKLLVYLTLFVFKKKCSMFCFWIILSPNTATFVVVFLYYHRK